MPSVSIVFDRSDSGPVPPYGAIGNIDFYNFNIDFSSDELFTIASLFDLSGNNLYQAHVLYTRDNAGRRGGESWGPLSKTLLSGLNVNQSIPNNKTCSAISNVPQLYDYSIGAYTGEKPWFLLASIGDDGLGTTVFNQTAYTFKCNVVSIASQAVILPISIYCPAEAAVVFGPNAIGIQILNIFNMTVRPVYKTFGANYEANACPISFINAPLRFSQEVDNKIYKHGACISTSTFSPVQPGSYGNNDFTRPLEYTEGILEQQTVRAPIGATIWGYSFTVSPSRAFAWKFVGESCYSITTGSTSVDFTTVTGKTVSVSGTSVASLTNGGIATGSLIQSTAPALTVSGPADPTLLIDRRAYPDFIPSPFASIRGDWMPGINFVGDISEADLP